MKNGKKLNKKVVLVLIIVLILAGGVGTYFILGKDKVEKIVDDAKKKIPGKKKEEFKLQIVDVNSKE